MFHILNEKSNYTTFKCSRSISNTDLTILSNKMLRAVDEWGIWDQDSCSEHIISNNAGGIAHIIKKE